MRALSIRQPSAWAILSGGQTVENYSHNVVDRYVGPLLIHAGLQLADQCTFEKVEDLADRPLPQLGAPAAPASLQLGGIVGLVRVTGSHRAFQCGGSCSPWAASTGWHMTLADPRVLRRMVPCPGRPRLFEPDAEVLVAVRRQLS